MKRFNTLKRIFLGIITSFFIFSCATVPQKAELETNMQLLPQETDIIIKADITGNRELLEPIISGFLSTLSTKDVDQFLDRTHTMWAGLDFNNQPKVKAIKGSIVAEGKYPRGFINLGFGSAEGWEKKGYKFKDLSNKEIKYWQDEELNVQLAIPDRQTILASTGDLEEMFETWAEKPVLPISKEWLYYEESSDISLMTRNMSPEDYAGFIPEFKKLPIKYLILSLKKEDDIYEISGSFNMESETAAFLFSTIFRTMILVAKDSSGKKMFPDRKAIKIEKNKNIVLLKGIRLSVEEIVAIAAKWFNPQKTSTY